MFRQSVLIANLVLVSLISFSASEPLRPKRNDVASENVPPPAENDPRCIGRKAEESWKEDCNTCFCGPKGIVGCTRMLCPPPISHTGQDVRCLGVSENDTISWKDDCNTCFCAASGIPACTRKLCLPESPADYGVNILGGKPPMGGIAGPIPTPADTGVDFRPPGARPTPADTGVDIRPPGGGIRYSSGPAGGIRYSAVPADAAEKATGEDSRCLNSSLKVSWKDDCNTCFCVGEGIPACTLMACFPKVPDHEPSAVKVKRETKSHCTADDVKANLRWKDDCRSCWCDIEGPPGCEKKACPPAGQRRKRETQRPACTKEEVGVLRWKEECNDCWCANEGIPSCTRKGCPPDGTKVKRDTKDLVSEFSADEEQADAPRNPYPHPLMSSASDVYPGVWTATAAVSVITAVLARV